MSVRGSPAPEDYLPGSYWESRARRFAREGAGLAAVCSYGMPEFYNRMIHRCQMLALKPWLQVAPGTRVLDVGCGVGRWSHFLAGRGARVTGVDLSPTMIAEADRRAAVEGVASRCRFLVQDLAELEVSGKFDLVIGVTVLQHILDPERLRAAVQRMTAHLAPGGRLVLLEAAPARLTQRCDTTVFQARERRVYLNLFRQAGLRLQEITGVDPAPFKTWLLPHLRGLPRPLATASIAFVTLLSAPVDLLFGRRFVKRSWHALFVLERVAECDFKESRQLARSRDPSTGSGRTGSIAQCAPPPQMASASSDPSASPRRTVHCAFRYSPAGRDRESDPSGKFGEAHVN